MGIDRAIEKTIKYAEKFGMVLDRDQLWKRLMGPRIFSKKEFNERADEMDLLKVKINTDNNRKILLAKKMVKIIIKNDRNILMVAITGSVAAENCRKKDDIDILIITKENRLWWSRLKLLFLLTRKGYKFRKYGKKEKKDDFCFNMWLEEKSLEIPKEKQNERSAIDLVLLRVLINKGGIYNKFLRENDWAKKWVATGYTQKLKVYKVDKVIKSDGARRNTIGDLANLMAFILQYMYMFPKITKETVGLKMTFFHVT